MRTFVERPVGAFASALIIALASGACSSGTSPDEKPTEARVQVTGTAPAQLRLVVSTDFFERIVDGQVVQVKNSADTAFIDLPYDDTVPLTDLGSVMVEVTNLEVESAQVEMRVNLDSGQPPYQQSATMSEGGTLRYVFVFLQTVL